MNKTPPSPPGFSLIEIIVAIAMVGLIASISIAVVSQIQSSAKEEKLASDTNTLNRAIAAYLASGGTLDGTRDPAEVLARLKSGASDDLRKRMPGFSSSLIDPRITAWMQSGAEAASGDPRAHWDSATQRFVIARSGAAGVKEFLLDASLAENPGTTETRDATLFYSKESNWVWDYQNRNNPNASDGATVVSVVADPSTPPTPAGVPPGGAPSPTPAPAPSGTLLPPNFSIPGGDYPINLYALPLSFSDPNPAGASKIIYAIDFGAWQDYTGTVSVPPGSTISAQSVALQPEWSDSGKIDQFYDAIATTLTAPVISPSRDRFGFLLFRDLTVTLVDSNTPGTAVIRYRLNGGAWLNYSGPFVVSRDDYPTGVTIEAQALSAGSPYYLTSTVSRRTITTDSIDLSGDGSGAFHNPTGPFGMVTNLAPGASNSYFEWGDGYGYGLSESWMDFTGGSFSDVADGERFQLGTLTYYNGSILSGTGADTVHLRIDLSLDVGGNLFNPYFDFTFDLVNTLNNQDPYNPWPDADYVRMTDPRASQTLVINDYEYEFRLEFGETTANGFSVFDEFHVLEAADASVNIYGTFVSLGQITASSAPDPVYQNLGYVDPEEAADTLLASLSLLENSASIQAASAEASAGQAERSLQDANDKLAAGDLAGAQAAADAARQFADDAAVAAAAADAAATDAAQASADVDALAVKDPSAEDEAQAAKDKAGKALGRAQQAADEAARAAVAANAAQLTIAAPAPAF